jgi:hypothetical protein
MKQILVAAAATAAAVVFSTSAAMANGYSGNWLVTVSHSQHSNGTACLTLNDQGSDGWRHSGSASLIDGSQKYRGSFQVIDGTLVTTIQVPGYGQNASLLFIGSAHRGSIGNGFFEDAYGGSDFDSGALAFMRGGC